MASIIPPKKAKQLIDHAIFYIKNNPKTTGRVYIYNTLLASRDEWLVNGIPNKPETRSLFKPSGIRLEDEVAVTVEKAKKIARPESLTQKAKVGFYNKTEIVVNDAATIASFNSLLAGKGIDTEPFATDATNGLRILTDTNIPLVIIAKSVVGQPTVALIAEGLAPDGYPYVEATMDSYATGRFLHVLKSKFIIGRVSLDVQAEAKHRATIETKLNTYK